MAADSKAMAKARCIAGFVGRWTRLPFTSSLGAYHCDLSSLTGAVMIILKPEINPLTCLHLHDVIVVVFCFDRETTFCP